MLLLLLLQERDMCSEPAASNEFMLYLHRAKMTQLVSCQYSQQIRPAEFGALHATAVTSFIFSSMQHLSTCEVW
jgi:hypothetical protein